MLLGSAAVDLIRHRPRAGALALLTVLFAALSVLAAALGWAVWLHAALVLLMLLAGSYGLWGPKEYPDDDGQ